MSSLLVCSRGLVYDGCVYDGCPRNDLVCNGDGYSRGNAGMDRPRGWKQIAGRPRNMLSCAWLFISIDLGYSLNIQPCFDNKTLSPTLSQPNTKQETNHPEINNPVSHNSSLLRVTRCGYWHSAMSLSQDRGRIWITVLEVDEAAWCTGMEEQDNVHHAVLWSGGLVWRSLVCNAMGLLGCDAPLQGMDGLHSPCIHQCVFI